MEIDKENVVQAVVIMDTFNNNFNPVTNTKAIGLLRLAGVRLIDYTLESLAQGGVGETVLFCCQDGQKIKDYVRKCIEDKAIWSFTMDVHVMISDTCQTMGDVMREIDAAGLVRGYFVLMGVTTITNIHFASLLEQHKQICKKDKGAAMTLVYKKVAWEHPLISSDKPIFLAADANTQKVLIHKKYKNKSTERTISLPLAIVLSHSEVKLHHNLADANIALCSPSVLPLFSDNFDFQTRDDFIHGILINEEILASSLYYLLLKGNQYAAAVTNWKTYQTIARDVLHNWAQPLSIETGSFSQNNFLFMDNHNFREKSSTLSSHVSSVTAFLIEIEKTLFTLYENGVGGTVAFVDFIKAFDSLRHKYIWQSLKNHGIEEKYITLIKNIYANSTARIKLESEGESFPLCREVVSSIALRHGVLQGVYLTSCSIIEDVLICANAIIADNTVVSKSFIGQNCEIGNNVVIKNSHIMRNVIIDDNCRIINSFIDENCVIEENSSVECGTIIASNVKVNAGSQLKGNHLESTDSDNEKVLLKSTSESTEWENESTGSGGDDFIGFEKTWSDSESCYSSDSSAESSLPDSPVPEDTNIFLQEVIDSLARGYEEKLKCDYLILEINSSRYAYNIQLHEVNFFVVRAMLSIPTLAEHKNVLSTAKDVLKYFRPVLANYIKTKSSIMDCLRAVEESCIKCEWLHGKSGQIIHLLYEAEVIDEDSLLEWREDLEENESPIAKQTSLVKFFEWLDEASEESDDSD